MIWQKSDKGVKILLLLLNYPVDIPFNELEKVGVNRLKILPLLLLKYPVGISNLLLGTQFTNRVRNYTKKTPFT